MLECWICHNDIVDDEWDTELTNPHDRWSPPEYRYAHVSCAEQLEGEWEYAMQQKWEMRRELADRGGL